MLPIIPSRRRNSLALLLAFLVAMSAPAAAAPEAPPALDARTRARVLDALERELLANYVEADTARMIAAEVRARQKSGAYDKILSPRDFSEAVTKDLRRVNGDLHLSLRFDPAGEMVMGGPRMVRRTEGGPAGPGGPHAHSGPMIQRRIVGGPGGPDSAVTRRGPMMPGALEGNYGFSKLEILAGNVGYLELTGFLEAPGFEEVMVGALRFLEHADAVIVDLRRNRGGSGNMSHLLFSHFLDARPVPTIRVKSRIEGLAREQESVAEVPGPRRTGVPLYVLTSRGTGSAAEEFSFVLRNLGRATLVGDRTAGAGHMVNAFPLSDGFVAGVSITRVSDPRTGLEWEAVGVQPHVRVPAERALAEAHRLALEKLGAAAPDEAGRRKYSMLAEWVAARDRAASVDAATAAALAGRYQGDRAVAFENGKLVYRRPPVQGQDLVPLGDGRWSLNGEARLSFAPGTPSASMHVERADGSASDYPRVTESQ